MIARLILLATIAWISLGAPTLVAKDLARREVNCAGRTFRYLLYQPAGERNARLPAILLLHGAHGEPGPMVDAWKKLAASENIVLIAMEIPSERWFEDVAPAVFRCEVRDSEQFAPIDPARVSVFGYSMGGYLAYDAAMYDSEFFAAVVVTSMGIDKDYFGILIEAKRKIPLAIYMGDSDPVVSLEGVRRTRDLLRKNAFPLHYVEIKNYDHNYFSISGQINADAWNFLRDKKLLG
jgi:dipeptidyl aminopeptidase/acylaminoacyl peptidase